MKLFNIPFLNAPRKKADFWRYGPEISQSDVYVYSACEYDGCTLCDSERRGKCDKIKEIIKKSNPEISKSVVTIIKKGIGIGNV